MTRTEPHGDPTSATYNSGGPTLDPTGATGTTDTGAAGFRTELLMAAACPVAPPGAQAHVDTVMGYVLWGVLLMFGIGVVIGIGAIVAGRIFSMPHASKAGVVSIVVVFAAGIGYLVLPGMIDSFMGSGCISPPVVEAPPAAEPPPA